MSEYVRRYRTLAKRLREQRERLLITQAELGALVGVDNCRISNMESGRKRPTLEQLLRLADHLGTSPDYLLGWCTREAKR